MIIRVLLLPTMMLELTSWCHPKFYFLCPKFSFYLMPRWHHFSTLVFEEKLSMVPNCHILASNRHFLREIYSKNQIWPPIFMKFIQKNNILWKKRVQNQNKHKASNSEWGQEMRFIHDAFFQVRHQLAF